MNKAQKIIWTGYLTIIFLGLLRATTSIDNSEGMLLATLFFGWIPSLIAHFIWRDKKIVLKYEDQASTYNPKRVSRGNFLITFVIAVLLFGLSIYMMILDSISPSIPRELIITSIVISIPLFIYSFLLLFFNFVKRYHDLSMSGWSIVWHYLPIVNLYHFYMLFFKKGDQAVNKYGEPNKKFNLKKVFYIK